MKTVCKKNACTACNACVVRCPVNAIRISDSLKNYNAYIDEKSCIKCGACTKVCQKNSLPEFNKPIIWKQGWANNAEDHSAAASGGAVTAIVKSFKNKGGIIYLCKFINGKFSYCELKSINQMVEFAGSKYVKSSMEKIYKQVKESLLQNKNVLFVGLPCQIAGLKKYVDPNLQCRLYTIDLICHGTPSAELLNKYLKEQDISLNDAFSVSFRHNNDFNLTVNNEKILYKQGRDRYSVLFLYGKTYTDNCYNCDFAKIERVSDITVGDSWGTLLGRDKQKEGISLILCQTKKGQRILENAQLTLFDVDLKRAIQYNHQLEKPMKKSMVRVLFFWLNKKITFAKAAMICFPIPCLNQLIRKNLKIFHIIY